jgi:serine/threonine protein kinase
MTEGSIFLALLEIDDASERLAYLDRVCAADSALRTQVEQLLKAHHEPGRFMDRPAAALVAPLEDPFVSEHPGTVIGPYKLLEQIGEGGMGVVFMAEQTQPVRRKVALKVLKPGMDTRQVIARFEAERQALALMDHPNIAHIFDGGETASGRPYFVMELVRGIPITDFCDQDHLPIRERLELYVTVCQAVQHAHQKGIIHRDLKPSNMLVTLHDDKAVVKVIDFGIAKATGQQLTEKTLFTNFAQMIGTPLYMSPEQAQMSGLDIDTRSDVYSLGVLLYELLTGTTPFDKERLRTAAYEEIMRIIREEDPAKPSTRISTLGQKATGVSANRQSDPRQLAQLCRGELDWIVMKALEKDRSRRYESASAFAADVQRYLKDEPVHACPPSSWYRLHKFARRHKRMAALTVATILLLLAATGVSSYFAIQADQRAREAFAQKERADASAKRADENAAKAQANLDIAYEVLDDRYMDVAEQGLPDMHALPKERHFLEKALRFYESLAKQQGTERRVRQQTGLAYLRVGNIQQLLGEEAKAKQNYRQALVLFEGLAAEFPNYPEYRHNLARCLLHMDQALTQAIDLLKELANQFPTNADYQNDLAESYAALGVVLRNEVDERAIPRDEVKPDKLLGKLADAEKVLRLALGIRGKLAEERPTEPNYRQALADSLSRLGGVLVKAGKLEEGEKLLRRGLDVRQKIIDDFPSLRIHRHYLGFSHLVIGKLLQNTGCLQEAEESIRQAAAAWRQVLEDFPNVPTFRYFSFRGLVLLGNVLEQMHRFAESDQAYAEARTIQKNILSDGRDPGLIGLNSFLLAMNPYNFEAYAQRAHAYQRMWELEKATADYTMALALMPPEHKTRGEVLFARSSTYRRLQDLSKEEADLQQIAELDLELSPEPPYLTAWHWPYPFNNLATRYLTGAEGQQDPRKALPLALKAVKLRPDYCIYLNTLGLAYYRLGEYSAAMEKLEHSLRDSKGEVAAINLFLLAMCQARRGLAAKAQDCYERAVQLLEEQRGKLHPSWKKELDAFRDEARALLQARKMD